MQVFVLFDKGLNYGESGKRPNGGKLIPNGVGVVAVTADPSVAEKWIKRVSGTEELGISHHEIDDPKDLQQADEVLATAH